MRFWWFNCTVHIIRHCTVSNHVRYTSDTQVMHKPHDANHSESLFGKTFGKSFGSTYGFNNSFLYSCVERQPASSYKVIIQTGREELSPSNALYLSSPACRNTHTHIHTILYLQCCTHHPGHSVMGNRCSLCVRADGNKLCVITVFLSSCGSLCHHAGSVSLIHFTKQYQG